MEDRIHIARTEKEYKEGLKNPSKNIMYFPNANQMTMKGMRTPIKYYGITDGRITDEGYAKPGQKFNVNGVSTLEVRSPQMRYGGRSTYQLGGLLDPQRIMQMVEGAKKLKARSELSTKPTIEINDLVNRLITAVQRDPENIQSIIANFKSSIPNYSFQELESIVPVILQNANLFPNESYKVILNDINLANNPETRQDERVGISLSKLVDRIKTKPQELKDAIAEFKNTIKNFHPSDVQKLGPQIAKVFERLPELRDEVLKGSNFDLKDYSYNPEFQKSIENIPERYTSFTGFPKDDLRESVFKESPILDTIPLDEKGFPGKQTIRENLSSLNKFRGPVSRYNPQDKWDREFISINNPNNPETYDYYRISDDPNNPIGQKLDANKSSDVFGSIKEYKSDYGNSWYPTPVYLRDKYGLNDDYFDIESPRLEKLVGPDKPFKTKELLQKYIQNYGLDKKYFFGDLMSDLERPEFRSTYTKPRGTASPGYTIPDWIGEGKEFESVEDYQKAIKEFAKETNTPYTLSGPNEGIDNEYGSSSHLFLNDPKRKAAFEEWKKTKKPITPTVTTTTTTSGNTGTGTTATTTNPAEAKKEEVKTEPKKDVTVDGNKVVKYTDPNSVESIYLDEKRYPNRWVQTPMGYVKLNDGYNHLPKGSQVSYNTNYPSVQDGYLGTSNPRGTVDPNDLDNELKRRKKIMDFYPGSLNSSTKRDEMDFGPGILNNPSIPTLFNSKKITQKLKGAYDKLDQGFDNFTNMINSDRSDRAARRAERFLARAEAAEAIGNDRKAGRLYRKADRQIARIEPLERIQDANEARRDAEAQIGLNKIDYRLGLKENRANERRISAEAEAMMAPQYFQNLKANKQSVQSTNEAMRRERTEGRYNRAKEDAARQTERNIIRADSRDFRTGLGEKYKGIKNQYNEEDKTQRVIDVYEDRDKRAQRGYNDAISNITEKNKIQEENRLNKRLNEERKQELEEKLNEIYSTSRPTDIESGTVRGRQKQKIDEYKLGGELPKFAGSGLFNGGDPDPIPHNYPMWTNPNPPKFDPWKAQEKPEPIKIPTIDASKDFSNWVKDRDEKFHNYYFDIGNPAVVEENGYWINAKNKDPKNSKGPGMKFYGFTPGEWTQFTGTMMPAFYNLAQSMRKPHKFKEFQNPYAGRYLSNLASQYMPYDDSKIVAQQNRVMRSAQQQAPNFQIAQAYQMAGMDGLNRQLKDYQMKNYMANQDYASKYNEAAYNVAGQQQAIKAQTYENDRKAQAALNQMQHKAVTQMGIGIHDLGKLMVNREMNAMDWSLMSQVYQQYGLAPFEAVMSGEISYKDMIEFNKNPAAMTQFLNKYEKAKSENAAAKQQQTTTTTEDVSNPGINASVSTMQTKKNGGRIFNLNVIKKY